MGAFFTNLHARGEDAAAFERALDAAGGLPAYVSAAAGGWLSAYPHSTERQDVNELDEIARAVSARLASVVFTFLVHDSDVFRYTFFENGTRQDEYDSAPGYFAGEPRRPPRGGDIDRLLGHCVPWTTADDLGRLLREKKRRAFTMSPGEIQEAREAVIANYERLRAARPDFPLLPLETALRAFDGHIEGLRAGTDRVRAEDLAGDLAHFLGIPVSRGTTGYQYLEQEGARADRIARHVPARG